MARPRSIFEKFSSPVTPSAQTVTRFHLVTDGDTLESIASIAYGIEEYDPDLWRGIAAANGIQNPITFSADFLGQQIVIPALPLPDFQ
jgi:nucleoid-associated protein YgaU